MGPIRPPGAAPIRVRRIIVAGVLTALLLGYIGPVRGYLDQRSTLQQEQARLHLLQRGALVEQMTARANTAGYPRMTVSTLVRDTRAVAFWRAMGFDDLFVVLANP